MKKPKYTRSFNNQRADNGMPVPFTGMRNHNLSNKELRTVEQPRTLYDKSTKWVSANAAAKKAALKKSRAPSTQITSGKSMMHCHHHGQNAGINGILQQMNQHSAGFLKTDFSSSKRIVSNNIRIKKHTGIKRKMRNVIGSEKYSQSIPNTALRRQLATDNEHTSTQDEILFIRQDSSPSIQNS